MNEIVIVGAGGFGRELLQWIKDINKIEKQWAIKGFIDDNLSALDRYKCDYQVIGKISEWQPQKNEVFACAIAHPATKELVVRKLQARGARFDRVIHPTCIISDHSDIGEGLVAYPNSGINVNTKIGDFVTLLSSGIGHDARIGNFTTISSYCDITGNVHVGEKVFIGSSVTIVPGRKIGDNAYIGAGSVVMTHIKSNTKVMGNPARKMDF